MEDMTHLGLRIVSLFKLMVFTPKIKYFVAYDEKKQEDSVVEPLAKGISGKVTLLRLISAISIKLS